MKYNIHKVGYEYVLTIYVGDRIVLERSNMDKYVLMDIVDIAREMYERGIYVAMYGSLR